MYQSKYARFLQINETWIAQFRDEIRIVIYVGAAVIQQLLPVVLNFALLRFILQYICINLRRRGLLVKFNIKERNILPEL